MVRQKIVTLCLIAMFALCATEALAQAAKELVGTWMLVSVTIDRGGTKSEPFGPNPKGLLVFDKVGRMSLVITRADLPKIAANSPFGGTAKENKAIAQGSIAYFGTYTVREEDRVFVVHVEAGTFPNWVGTDQKRIFVIAGDQLKYTSTERADGDGTALAVWKRVK